MENFEFKITEQVDDFKTLPSAELNGGIQYLVRFPNGYGASIVQHSFSYGREAGLWEMAVLKFKDGATMRFGINYDTPLTDDVLGSLNEQQVNNYLFAVKNLKQ